MAALFVHRLAMLLIGICLANAGVGCGRKMDPIRPGVYPPPAVRDLAYQINGSAIVLTWFVPVAQGEQEAPAAGFKILRARQTPAEAECQTCPVRFQVIGEVTARGRSAISRPGFRDKLEPGFTYRYKVKAYSSEGIEGKDSNVIVLTH